MSLRRVALLDDLWNGEMMGLEVDGNHILLINVDDRIYAYADACPHQKSR
jgi:toluene monooxygenase system ferredoxin subunit